MGSIALNNIANDFIGAVSVQGADVSLTDANVLTMGAANTSGNLTLVSAGDLTLGATTVGGNLNATSSQGNIAQTGIRRVTGTTKVTAPSGTVPQDVEFAAAAAGAIQNVQQMVSNIPFFGVGVAGASSSRFVATSGVATTNTAGAISAASGGLVFVDCEEEAANTDSSIGCNSVQASREAQGFTNIFVIRGGIRLPTGIAQEDNSPYR